MLRPVTVSDEPTIRAGLVVVGQWKPARAMGPLDALAADSRWDGVRSVYGRGWPTVAGWQVHPRFLDEAVLTRVITGAECLVLPYERYFQSGVAVRALECLTPVVGARHPFLEELLGVDWPGLVDGDDWPGAVDRVLSYDREEMTRLREAAWERCVAAWGRWAQTAFDRCPGRLGSPP